MYIHSFIQHFALIKIISSSTVDFKLCIFVQLITGSWNSAGVNTVGVRMQFKLFRFRKFCLLVTLFLI